MHTVGAFEAKTHFSSLLEEVEKGEQIIITKHGRPIAKLIPVGSRVSRNEIQETILGLKKFASKHTLDLDWKELRDEGRR